MVRVIEENIDSPDLLVDNNLYENEAAHNAFFNAPKITTRSVRRIKAKAKETDDEEEVEHETYDESWFFNIYFMC